MCAPLPHPPPTPTRQFTAGRGYWSHFNALPQVLGERLHALLLLLAHRLSLLLKALNGLLPPLPLAEHLVGLAGEVGVALLRRCVCGGGDGAAAGGVGGP